MNEVVEVRMASWQTMVQNRNASGLSIKDWCPANKVSESQYYYRLRQLRNAALSVASQTSTLNVGEFTPIPLRPAAPSSCVSLRLRHADTVIEVSGDDRCCLRLVALRQFIFMQVKAIYVRGLMAWPLS